MNGPDITEELEPDEHIDVYGQPFCMPKWASIPLETAEECAIYWQRKAAYAEWRLEQLNDAVCDVLGERKRERVLTRASDFEGASPMPDGYLEAKERLYQLVESRLGRKLRREP